MSGSSIDRSSRFTYRLPPIPRLLWVLVTLATLTGFAACAVVTGDFNGDGKADILWRNAANGQVAVWMMNGANVAGGQISATVGDLNWHIIGTGDFNGDGKADILWQNSATGQAAVWLMNGASVAGGQIFATVSDLNWQIVGIGDFDGDGKADILWRNLSTGQTAVWFMNGASVVSGAYSVTVSDPNWHVAGVGDFNGDGKADILWQNASTGQTSIWLMNGANIVNAQLLVTVGDLSWQIVGVGDFNGDGKADILWRNSSSGQIAVWTMNGTSIQAAGYSTTVTDLNWKVIGIGDFNGDGKADILWQNATTGDTAMWMMNGANPIAMQYSATVSDGNWQVAGPGEVIPAVLKATAVSNASPLPLTPLRISTQGMDSGSPVTVQYTNASGFSSRSRPIRLAGGGTVVAAVPLYIDPISKAITQGTVQVSVSQAGRTSNALTLTIQNLPSVPSWGITPGAVSHSLLVFQGMQAGRRLNAYQAFQGSVGNAVDTTQAQNHLLALLSSTIGARSDVDRVTLNPSLSIPAAQYQNGTTLNFDATTLDMMDRVQAVFLSQTFGQLALSAQAAQAKAVARAHQFAPLSPFGNSARLRFARRRSLASPRTLQGSPKANPATPMQQILLALQGFAASGQIPLSTIDAIHGKNIADEVAAIASGASGVGGLASSSFGYYAGLLGTVNTVTHCWTDDGIWAYAKMTGNQPLADVVEQDMAAIPSSEIIGALKTLVVPEQIGVVAQLGSTVFDLGMQGYKYYCTASSGGASTDCPAASDAQVSQQVVASNSAVFASPTQGIGQIDGIASVSSNLGIEAPQPGVEMNFAPGGSTLAILGDPNGNYSMFVPLGQPNFDYSSVQLSMFDPLSFSVYMSESVNLSNLSIATPINVPMMQGICSDTDASTPDGDDPDCD